MCVAGEKVLMFFFPPKNYEMRGALPHPTPPALHPYPQRRRRQRRRWRRRGRRSFERYRRRATIRPTSRSASCARTRGRTCRGFRWDSRWRSIADDDGTGGSTTTTTTTNTMTTTNTTARRMGRGRAGERTMGENPITTVTTSSASRPSAAWGIGHRSSAPTPPPPSSTTTTTTIAAAVGGRRAPPLRSVPAGRRSSLSMSPTAVDGGGTRAFGVWL